MMIRSILTILTMFVMVTFARDDDDEKLLAEAMRQINPLCGHQFRRLFWCALSVEPINCPVCLGLSSLEILAGNVTISECNDLGDFVCGSIDGCTSCGDCADLGK